MSRTIAYSMTMKLGRLELACLSGACAWLLASCGKSPEIQAGPAAAAPRKVSLARVESRPMERTLQVVGTLAARDEAAVAAQVAGQIELLSADLGDRVTAGQELALIDTASYEALVRQSEANLARTKASAANAAQNLKRIQDLQKEKISSTSDLDQAVAEADRTRAEVKAAEAAEAIARLNLARSRVRAPFDGAIAQRLVAAGNYVSVGVPIVRLVKTDPLRLRLEVPERASSAVRPEQEVRLTVEGDANTYTGKLARIAPAIRQSDRMLPVEADVPNPGTLRAGLFARAQIILSTNEESLSIPTNALITFAGLEKVVVLRDGKAAEKTVTTGRRGADWIEINSGLNAGETVVLNPAGIRTGQPLTFDAKAR
jgi:membrane fusion protein (multidrug efflux system)